MSTLNPLAILGTNPTRDYPRLLEAITNKFSLLNATQTHQRGLLDRHYHLTRDKYILLHPEQPDGPVIPSIEFPPGNDAGHISKTEMFR